MTYPGAAPPPPGFTPDLDNPDSMLRTVNYATQSLTLLFTTLFIVTRFYAKWKVLGGGVTMDDYATYSAYILMIGYCITSYFASAHGGGLNQWEVRKDDIQPFFQSCYAATLFYAPMALTVKLALLVIIIRVFGSVHKKTLIGVYVLVALLVIYYVSGFFIKLFICWPISAYWKGETEKCMNQSAIVASDAIISVISDLTILLLPLPLTWSLQLPKRKRLRVCGLLCAGGIATAFSIYRLAMIVHERESTNQTIVFMKVILSGNAEAGIGLICACLPAVNALYVQQTRGSSYFKHGDSNQQSQKRSQSQGGEIMMTRTFHVDSSSAHYDSQSVGNDESALVAKEQQVSLSHKSSQGSDSMC
ncbi:PTH11-type GPCR [Pochonia chlamydosporia 170]|uniref:PTH11-type GPCR n=1 Tax=Pochonia chlamydosporia 170 TaxID=1380566 RepID=A0A179FIB1_METCM|nr:PTH11-type GPCR [Pochonia chlamydosporia 170]OAQ65018.2 PTH11-type GPCR [Pochonia chlamydosporia 170]